MLKKRFHLQIQTKYRGIGFRIAFCIFLPIIKAIHTVVQKIKDYQKYLEKYIFVHFVPMAKKDNFWNVLLNPTASCSDTRPNIYFLTHVLFRHVAVPDRARRALIFLKVGLTKKKRPSLEAG